MNDRPAPEPAARPSEGPLARARAVFARAEIERRLALFLVVAAIVSAIATYAAIGGLGTGGAAVRTVVLLLNLDLVLLLLLGAIVARRLVGLFLARRGGGAASRLHTRLVGLFSLLAVTPAILVAVFSVVFLASGLESWFSARVRTALENSLKVAEAYLAEHREVIRADALAMAADLNREGPLLLDRPQAFRQFVTAQAAIRALTEAVVFDGGGRVLAASGLGVVLGFEGVPEEALARAARGEVVTLTSDTEDRVRALVRLEGFGDAYLYVGRLVDPKVLAFMERTQEVVSDYRLIETERSGIQITSSLIFMTVALLLLMAAVWLGIGFADRLAVPLGRLIEAAERVRAGDLVVRVPEPERAEDELGLLARTFNRMTSQLEAQRRALVEANRELDERRRFIETVLAGVTAGVVGLDRERRVLLANRSAAALLGVGEEELPGRPLEDLLPEIAPLFLRLRDDPERPVEESLAIARKGRLRTLLVRLAPQPGPAGPSGFVLTFDDISELIAAQRQAAWAEVARRIAHEIKNPLTPIRLTAERLGRRFRTRMPEEEREGFGRAVDTIVQQVDVIGRLVSEFSAFARMPAPVFRSESLAALLRKAVDLQESARQEIDFRLELPPDDPLVLDCDAEKIVQVMTNLLQNAVDALLEGPPRADGARGRIVVRARRAGREILVEVEDNGPGFPPGDRHRLLEPYATTRAKGTGLGLAIVRKIMEEHDGRVELADGEEGGALVRLAFPARATREPPAVRTTETGRPQPVGEPTV
ncbi:MAG: PAS domain-containing sensor histidine kinase [Geminicoccaceae bacterium]|nr:PAS domain-containing sensor histidine kinase [Geminicoccaceae bacterium]MDW8341234.1 PAS domain-containing sensor histidine kinase [Geminicoccaceae bacterium]